ncbi:wall-associated receptor kinase-like 14 [Prunus yedoensis var. nudiflora]|uniref:Wall-associated receptor kinase-like 14 n=1 Tax=Prunus yedoensis var. nudiflora TaxID=2094558 RepID=A0A314XGC6_PRUYE|nr:wall-associated receptor kinase-like 14 [Prunus yedoensis var. nudiflora]
MVLHQNSPTLITIITILITTTSIATIARAQNSTFCKPTCGSGKSAKSVQYPFGFSEGCVIPLNCSDKNEIKLGEFRVQNVTGSSIFVHLPAQCNREYQSIAPLFGPNFGPSWNNSLLFQNCTSPLPGCQIPAEFVQKRFNLSSCDNITCMSPAPIGSDIMRLNQTRCKYLFGSFSVQSGRDSLLSLEFETLQLGWWVHGPCKCHLNATSTTVKLGEGKPDGCRCSCKAGFDGDGFTVGSGCQPVSQPGSRCNASKYMSGRCGGTTRVAVLIGGIVAGAFLMASLFLLCYFVRRRSTCLRNQLSARRLLSEAAGNSSVPLYPYKEIERATNCFAEKQRLGTGAFGIVYAGKLHNDEWVAIKKNNRRDTNSIDQVLNEIKLLSSVSHPNLVRLLGCCIEGGEQILVYEYMPNGTLSEHLQRERGQGLPWTIRLTIAAETANAIAYLHSAMNPPIYHRDIKSSNILLDYNYKSKVADFGLSRLGMTESSYISTAPQGTPGYVDPQYHQNFHLSDKSDVYSFGVVLVEIITAMKVVDFARPQSEVNLAALAIDRIGKGCVDEIVDPFLEPNRDAWTLYSVNKVAELAFRCLAFHSDMRPSMIEVAEELEYVRRSGWATMEENICMESSVASSCSSPYNGSEKSLGSVMTKKAGIRSQRSIASLRVDSSLATMEEDKDSSPVCVHDHWLSEQSSPSTNSLLGNAVHT